LRCNRITASRPMAFTGSFGTQVISERYSQWLVGRLFSGASSVCF
jgi:hypothetical protein